MGFRNIMISNPVELCVKNQQLKIGEKISFPLEDMNSLLIETSSVKLSAYFLQKAADFGIVVYLCDEKHIPNAVLLPLSRHSRHFKMLKNQMEIHKPLQKRLWQQIIIQKIENQAKCLEFLEKEGSEELRKMSKEVQSGDKTHVEGKAAAFYFRRLFGEKFTRNTECRINAALNYSYAIIRGMIARSIVCYGFEPALGIFHHSECNSFNLADDFIEPFRAVVDLFVAEKEWDSRTETGLTPEIKRELFAFMSCDVEVQGELQLLSNAVDKLVMSFSSCLAGNREELLLPKLVKIKRHRYE